MVDSKLKEIEENLIPSNDDALTKMKNLIALSNMVQGNEPILAALHSPSNAPMHVRILAEIIIKFAPLYEKVIIQGCKEGLFHTTTPLESAELLLSAIQFLTDTGFYPWPDVMLKRRLLAVPRLIEQQLGASVGSF
jgi:hypothetical protein